MPAAPAVLAVLPLAVAAVAIAVRHPHIAWTDDRALTELAVREALRGHQLLGIGGRFGWRHPGPLWLYLLSPLYALTGRAPWSLAVGALAVHAAMVAVAVEALRRIAGLAAAAVLAVAVAAYLTATGLGYWTNLWAGYAFTWPVLTLIVLAAVATAEEEAAWALGAGGLIGTLLVQTDVSTIVPVAFIGAAAVALRWRRFGVRRLPSRVALLAAAAWIPPLVQEAGAHQGNMTLLLRYAFSGAGGHPMRTALSATGAALSVLPFGARWVLRAGADQHLRPGPWWAVLVAVAYAGGLAALARVAWRRGRRLAGDLAALTAVGVLAAIVAMSRVDGPVNFYLLTWITILPVAAAAAVGAAVAPGSRAWIGPVALTLTAVLALVLVARQGTTESWNRPGSADVAAMTGLVRQALPFRAGELVDVHVVTADTWGSAAGVALQLERSGARIEVDRQWVFLFGDAFAPRRGFVSAELWFARPHELPALTSVAGVVELGVVDGVDVLARAY